MTSSTAPKRAFDFVASGLALVVLSPLMSVIAVVIRIAEGNPILYRAARVGRGGEVFTMHKFRTMRVGAAATSRITASADPRVFPLGSVLRRWKLDELPQLWDVLRGVMSIVGPRPEDPELVARFYTEAMRETLAVRPGLTSPGALWGTLHGEAELGVGNPEEAYASAVLPMKLALERVYVRDQTLLYDLRIIGRTIWGVLHLVVSALPAPGFPELPEAVRLVESHSVS